MAVAASAREVCPAEGFSTARWEIGATLAHRGGRVPVFPDTSFGSCLRFCFSQHSLFRLLPFSLSRRKRARDDPRVTSNINNEAQPKSGGRVASGGGARRAQESRVPFVPRACSPSQVFPSLQLLVRLWRVAFTRRCVTAIRRNRIASIRGGKNARVGFGVGGGRDRGAKSSRSGGQSLEENTGVRPAMRPVPAEGRILVGSKPRHVEARVERREWERAGWRKAGMG